MLTATLKLWIHESWNSHVAPSSMKGLAWNADSLKASQSYGIGEGAKTGHKAWKAWQGFLFYAIVICQYVCLNWVGYLLTARAKYFECWSVGKQLDTTDGGGMSDIRLMPISHVLSFTLQHKCPTSGRKAVPSAQTGITDQRVGGYSLQLWIALPCLPEVVAVICGHWLARTMSCMTWSPLQQPWGCTRPVYTCLHCIHLCRCAMYGSLSASGARTVHSFCGPKQDVGKGYVQQMPSGKCGKWLESGLCGKDKAWMLDSESCSKMRGATGCRPAWCVYRSVLYQISSAKDYHRIIVV